MQCMCEDTAQKEVTIDIVQFVEYDQRAHRLNTLVTFSFWVQSTFDTLSYWKNTWLTYFRQPKSRKSTHVVSAHDVDCSSTPQSTFNTIYRVKNE